MLQERCVFVREPAAVHTVEEQRVHCLRLMMGEESVCLIQKHTLHKYINKDGASLLKRVIWLLLLS